MAQNECYSSTVTADNCTNTAVNRAIGLASAGDTVAVPDGNCTWTSTNSVTIDKEITLQGNGVDNTVIIAGSRSANGCATIVSITAANVTVKGFRFRNQNVNPEANCWSDKMLVFESTATPFRVTNNKMTGYGGNMISVYGAYGLIDNNTINQTGWGEFVQVDGPCDSWTTDSTMSNSANNVFFENNIIGHATDANGRYITCNANARCVFRYNNIWGEGGEWFDLHQYLTSWEVKCSANHRGGRHIVVNNNYWNLTKDTSYIVDLMSGTGRVFNNVIVMEGAANAYLKMGEYGYTTSGSCLACEYPYTEQVGRGKNEALEPAYWWNNKKGTSLLNLVAVNPYVSSGAQCATAGTCGEDFTSAVIIAEDRDYYNAEDTSFTEYACPHPLTGLTKLCDSTVAGTAGYNALEAPSTGAQSLSGGSLCGGAMR